MNYGFIGLGNMAEAIISGMTSCENFKCDNIYGIDKNNTRTEIMISKYGLIPCKSIKELMDISDTVVLAVKPQVLPKIMDDVSKGSEGKIIISIAAGKTLEWYDSFLPKDAAMVRVMPNINAIAHASVSAICNNCNVSEKQLCDADKIFASVGSVYHIEEKMFPAFSAICGASGAFIHLYIDALAESGVKAGFPRELAEEFATETVYGSAKLKKQTKEHPIVLMNRICSPGGTTIEGVMKLKELGFETAVQKGIEAIIEKDNKL